MLMRSSWTLALSCVLITSVMATSVMAQSSDDGSVSPLTDEGKLVVFERDIAPIFKKYCLDCHGPDDAKNDFRIDDREYVLDYLEPEDAESSTLFVDYMATDDADMLMPPKSHNGPLSASDLALIRVWINEGANWPEDYQMVTASADSDMEPAPALDKERTLSERVWAAQGYLHPATVHFPIALFLLGGGFVVLGWKWPSVGTQIPLACLCIGAMTSVASSAMGWAFAPEQGYGTGWSLFDWNREVDTHRWSALIVTIFSLVLTVIALISLWNGSERLTKIWKVGLLLCAGMVGAVGHQGGELSYGADFYPRAWRILTNTSDEPGDAEAVNAESESTEADSEESDTTESSKPEGESP